MPPRGASAKQPLFCEVELLAFHAVKVVPHAPGLVTKRVLREGAGLETPHAPYEVTVRLDAALPRRWPGGGAPPEAANALFASREVRFALGSDAAPPSLQAALASMRPGERAALFCAPACAAQPAAALPELRAAQPAALLDGVDYSAELVSFVQVRDLHGDGSLLKRRLQPGRGDFPVDCPIRDCALRCHVAVWALGADGARVEPPLSDTRAPGGEALAFDLATGAQPPGLEAALRLMLPGEVARVTAAARHAYDAPAGGRWARPPGLLPGAAVEWELQLLDFTHPVNWYQAEPAEILAEAAAAKEAGVALFRDGAWAHARQRFEALAAQLAGLRGLEDEEEAAAVALRAVCLLNAAAAAQKLGEHAAAAQRCTEVLERMGGGAAPAKALYRRAVSRTALGDWAGAAEDLDAARVADPTAAPDCDRQAAKLKAAQRAAAQSARAQLGGFLARAGADAVPPDA